MPLHRLPIALSFAAVVAAQGAVAPAPALRLQWVPAGAVAVLDVAGPARFVGGLARALGGWPRDLPADVAALVSLGLLAVRNAVGGDFATQVEKLAGGGAVLAWAPQPSGWGLAAAVRPADPVAALDVARRLFPRACLAEDAGWLLLGERPQALEAMRAARAGERRWDAAALPSAAPDAAVLAVDLAAVRAGSGGGVPALEGLGGQARFWFAPFAHALRQGRHLRASLAGGDALQLWLDVDASAIGTPLAELLTAAGTTRAILPMPDEAVACLVLDRSLHRLLARPAAFLPAAAVTDVESFLSVAESLDGPHTSIVDDLVGRLDEPAMLYVLRPAVPLAHERPPLLLPDAAVVVRVRDDRVESVVRRVVGLLLVIANAERVQRRQGPLALRDWRCEHGAGLVAELPEWRGPGAPPVESVLSPVVAFGSGHMVLATTARAAERLLEACGAEPRVRMQGDLLVLRGAPLADVVAASRAALQLARMLDEGEDEARAARFFAVFDAVARAVREISVTGGPEQDRTSLTLRIERTR